MAGEVQFVFRHPIHGRLAAISVLVRLSSSTSASLRPLTDALAAGHLQSEGDAYDVVMAPGSLISGGSCVCAWVIFFLALGVGMAALAYAFLTSGWCAISVQVP